MAIEQVDFPHFIEPNLVEFNTGSVKLPKATFTASGNAENSFFKAEFIIIAVLLVAALMLMKVAK